MPLAQVVNYASAPLCVRLRDLDLLVMQTSLAALIRPPDDLRDHAHDDASGDGTAAHAGVAAAPPAPSAVPTPPPPPASPKLPPASGVELGAPTDADAASTTAAAAASSTADPHVDDEETRFAVHAQSTAAERSAVAESAAAPSIIGATPLGSPAEAASYFVLSFALKLGVYRWMLVASGATHAQLDQLASHLPLDPLIFAVADDEQTVRVRCVGTGAPL